MSAIVGKNYELPALDLNFAENKSLIDSVTGRNLITFSRSQSGKEATYVGSDGLIKYASADEPRFDYNPETGESLGLLIEEQRTNVTWPSDFSSNWNYTNVGDGIKQTSYGLAPDGTISSLLVQPNSSTRALRNFTSPGIAAGTYTVSFFYKGDKPLSIGGPGANELVPDGYDYGNGWKRAIKTLTFTGGGYLDIFVLANTSVELWGIQAELGSFASSYIPTKGSTVARAADVANISGSNFSSWYNQTASTVLAEINKPFTGVFSAFGSIFNANDGTVTNRIGFVHRAAGQGSLYSFSNSAGSNSLDFNSFNTNAAGAYKYALAITANSARSAGDGNLLGAADDTSVSVPTVLNQAVIRAVDSIHISRLTYWPTRLPGATLQAITAP